MKKILLSAYAKKLGISREAAYKHTTRKKNPVKKVRDKLTGWWFVYVK